MIKSNKMIREQKDSNLISFIRFRFVPYWPLFALLLTIAVGAAFVYIKWAPPIYQAKADLLIKDENKGSGDGRVLESLNVFSTKKIVEDEIEVLQSQTLVREVVRNLDLYAPVTSKGRFKTYPAYISSPVIVEALGFDSLYKDHNKVFLPTTPFVYDSAHALVKTAAGSFPVGQWVSYPGTSLVLRFLPNPRYSDGAMGPLSFTVLNPKLVTNSLIGRLNVSSTNKLSSVVTLTLSDEVPRRGEDILNELIDVYDHASINDKNQLAMNTLAFVENRLLHVRHELDSAENTLQRSKAQNGGGDLSEQGSAFLQNVSANDQKASDIDMQLAVLNEVEKYVRSESNTGIVPSTLGIDDEGLSNLLQKLYDDRANYDKLHHTVGENNPVMQSLAGEIQKIKPNILENIRIRKLSLQAGLANLQQTNDKYATQLHGIPGKERSLLESSRQQSILSNVYSFLLQKREEASLSYASTIADSRTIDRAESSLDPISPKKIIVLGIALAAALLFGCVVVYCQEFTNSRILFRREIETYTGVPIIAELAAGGRSRSLLVSDQPRPVVLTEQFRQLRTALGLHAKNNKNRKLLVTSSISGEGKSFVSANLAVSLASAGKKVILLDFDLRNPRISAEFEPAAGPGLADFLQGDIEPYEIIKSTSYKNLFITAAGDESGSLTDLSFNSRLGELFDYLDGVFDFIVVDTPPVHLVSDAYVLTEYCDLSLYVVRHDFTPKAFIQLLDENDKIKPLKNLVIVFNSIKSRGFFGGKYGLDLGYGNEFSVKQRRVTSSRRLHKA
ncbi:MAG TPA: polysaccharide biosynthesis tyrosine autokinase [Puia sp.]|nr:polysaccharide biosynthesis tyrosine autokinase [Puia sp.]